MTEPLDPAAARLAQGLRDLQGDERVRFVIEKGALWITIDREDKRNALALSMLDSLAAGIRLLGAPESAATWQPGVRLVVVRGAGLAHFAAGGDLTELDALRTQQQALAMAERGMAALDAIRNCPLPVIAAVNGAARGGGAELAMACDLRLGHGESALGFVQAGLGLSPAWGGGRDLLQRLTPARGLLHLLDAELLQGSDALAAGLLDRIIAEHPTGFEAALARQIDAFAARPLQVLVALKQLSRGVASGLHEQALASLEARHLATTWAHDDHWALLAAAARRRAAAPS